MKKTAFIAVWIEDVVKDPCLSRVKSVRRWSLSRVWLRPRRSVNPSFSPHDRTHINLCESTICRMKTEVVWPLKLSLNCILSSASHKASKLLLQPALSLAHFIFPFAILKSVPGFHNDTLFMRMGPNNRSLNRTAVVLPDGVRQDISRFVWWHTTLYNMVNIPFEMLF